ncbi:hypothetical protein ACEN2I_02540 [Flavobacterium sp. W22_SRS_FK3]|uniref:hypothetical protein n=1 Tax=Flavobacterium sp. W22_SRS_FK3 TaxID=3240275 RepID=UPI003F92689A
MKRLGLALLLLMNVFAHAQVSINVNIGTPPNWAPQGNDDSRYYYLPDIDTYYDVSQSQYIYVNNGQWIRDRRLPARYRQYDLYSGYKVVLNDYKGNSPYIYHTKHRADYPKGYHGKPQKNRGNKPVKNDKHNNRQQPKKGSPEHNDSNKSKGNSNKG